MSVAGQIQPPIDEITLQHVDLYIDDQVYQLRPGTDGELVRKQLVAAMTDGSVVQVPAHDLSAGDYIVYIRPHNAIAVSVRSGKGGHN